MPFGAHETMEAHEILSDSINMINHFAFYAKQCQDPQLRGMLDQHMQTAIESYNNLLAYTHTYNAPSVQPKQMQYVNPNQLKYGLRNPAMEAPQLSGQTFTDQQIAQAMLSFHKCSAKNNIAAALECADPNVRKLLTNASTTCANYAYETFKLMNQKGWYQVPTIDSHTAKTMLHHYQPAGQISEQGFNQAQMTQAYYQGQGYQPNIMSGQGYQQSPMTYQAQGYQQIPYQNQGSQGLAGFYKDQGYQSNSAQASKEYTQFSKNIELLD